MARASTIIPATRPTIVKTDPAERDKRFSPALIVFGALCLSLLSIGIAELRIAGRFGTFFFIARNLDQGGQFSADVIKTYAAKIDSVATGNYCRSTVIRSALSIALADLDLQNSSRDYDGWAASFGRTEKFLKHAISCAPTDGNLWVRLAMVERAIAERPDSLAAILNQSAWLAPAEIQSIRARFFLWKDLSKDTLALTDDALQSDLRTLLNYGQPAVTARTIQMTGTRFTPIVKEALSRVSPERRAELAKAGLDYDKLP